MSFNLVILMGNVTRDPEIKYLPRGTAVAEFGIAVNKVWFNELGEKQEAVTFVDLVAREKGAEWAGKHLKKGMEIHVTGELKLDQWDDKQTGERRSKLRVNVTKLVPTFGTWKEKGESRYQDGPSGRTDAPGRAPQRQQSQTQPQRPPQGPPRPPHDPDLDGAEDDDIPF